MCGYPQIAPAYTPSSHSTATVLTKPYNTEAPNRIGQDFDTMRQTGESAALPVWPIARSFFSATMPNRQNIDSNGKKIIPGFHNNPLYVVFGNFFHASA